MQSLLKGSCSFLLLLLTISVSHSAEAAMACYDLFGTKKINYTYVRNFIPGNVGYISPVKLVLKPILPRTQYTAKFDSTGQVIHVIATKSRTTTKEISMLSKVNEENLADWRFFELTHKIKERDVDRYLEPISDKPATEEVNVSRIAYNSKLGIYASLLQKADGSFDLSYYLAEPIRRASHSETQLNDTVVARWTFGEHAVPNTFAEPTAYRLERRVNLETTLERLDNYSLYIPGKGMVFSQIPQADGSMTRVWVNYRPELD